MKKRWSYSLLLAAIVLISFVLSVPLLVHWQLERRLSETFGEPVRLDDLSLQPFDARLTLTGLAIGDAQRIDQARIEVSVTDLLKRRLIVEALHVEGVQLSVAVDADAVVLGKLSIPLAAKSPAAGQPVEATFFSDVRVEQTRLASVSVALDYAGHRHQIELAELQLGQLTPGLRLPLDYRVELTFDGNPVDAAGNVRRLEVKAGYQLESDVSLSLELADINGYVPAPLAGQLQFTQQLVLTTRDAPAEAALELKAEGSITADNLVLADSGVALATVNWAGTTTLALTNDTLVVNALGELRGGGLRLLQPRELNLDAFDWSGNLGLEMHPDASPTVTAKGEFAAGGLVVPPFGAVGSVTLRGLDYSSRALVAQSLTIADLDLRLAREADGALVGLPWLPVDDNADLTPAPEGSVTEDFATAGELKAGEPDAKTPDIVSESVPAVSVPDIDLQQLTLTGQIGFRDASITPAAAIALRQIDLTVTNIAKDKVAKVALTARHQEEGQVGGLAVSGTVRPLGEPLLADLTVEVTQFELHQLSGYLQDGIRSGRLTLNSEVTIEGAQLQADNRVRIAGLKVDTRADAASVGEGLSLTMALKMLKDSDDMIDLNVPVSSETGKFSVDTSDIINTALANAARRAAISYATRALQPLGTLLLIKDVAGVVSRPRFEPVEFEAGSAELSESAQAYAAKMAELLQSRPALTLTLCGYATARDRIALGNAMPQAQADAATAASLSDAKGYPADSESPTDTDAPLVAEETLLALAQARSNALTQAIRAAGISGERLFGCRPALDKSGAEPRVEINL